MQSVVRQPFESHGGDTLEFSGSIDNSVSKRRKRIEVLLCCVQITFLKRVSFVWCLLHVYKTALVMHKAYAAVFSALLNASSS